MSEEKEQAGVKEKRPKRERKRLFSYRWIVKTFLSSCSSRPWR
ncbi:hypothetical protein [Paraflavitalea speifideaquila]|nr:hypothetical protein [Paraflavitalea speifideiaquila]